ncbi:MAG: hypothetical protein K6G83_13190 [Lachnospiraceae bacterium]|nr:hypothetical protein [Lachnospiraceae bacterium]
MALVAPVVDGAVTTQSTEAKMEAEKRKKSNSMVDKESFLQLLVAQMKYQDPMEPTSNTEYISQYAQFSELEQMQNMSASMNLQRASGLVGQYGVIEHVNEATGNSTTIEGKIDFITYENNKAYLNINGEAYSIDELVNVMDADYANAVSSASALSEVMGRLPGVEFLGIGDRADVELAQSIFNSMSVYAQSFVSDDQVTALQEYVTRMSQIVANAEAAEKKAAEKEAAEQEKGQEEKTETEEKAEETEGA